MPEIEDGDTFRCTLKLGNGNQGSNQGNEVGNQGNQPLNEKQLEVLKFCITPRSAAEIFSHLKISKQAKNRKLYITELIEFGVLAMTIPDKPHDMHQKYITIEKR